MPDELVTRTDNEGRTDGLTHERSMPFGMPDDFTGRVELEALLLALMPDAWWDAVAAADDARLDELKGALDNPARVRALGEAGWVAPHYAVEYGGRGLPRTEARRALSLLAWCEVPHVPRGSGLPLAAPTIEQWSTDETKRRLLPPLLAGVERWCQLFSEPGAGSDMASLATTAVRDGDEWVVNGQKVWTTFGHESEMAMLIARTDTDQPKHKGITYFGLDMRAAGVEVRPLINMAGQLEFNEVFMTDVRIPDLLRISPVGEGWSAAMTTLGAERLALSGARKKRKSSDEILGGKPYDEVATMAATTGAVDSAAARDRLTIEYVSGRLLWLTSQRARARAAAGQSAGPEGSVTKIAKAAANQHLQEAAIDMLGADALAWDVDDTDAASWIEQFLRTRANSIEGGTSEIQRNIVGERVLGLPREPDPFRGVSWRDVPRS
jgi:alkylation response protein AidB-like acyl-CoA dehydrogenase